MKRNILIISLIAIISNQLLFSQSITNVQASAEGNTVVVTYILNSPTSMEISLYVSEDGGGSFAGPLKSVRGDVGTGIQPGNKRIMWEVLNEREYIHNSNMVFRVNAELRFGTFRDSRDGKTYKTVKIGKQVWMAENLAYKSGSGNYWANSDVAKFGYLYDWQTAKNGCPTGWHLPSDAEWKQVVDFVRGEGDAGNKLKAKSGWTRNGNGTDDFGFSALPGGDRYTDGSFFGLGESGHWWSSTEYDAKYAWVRSMNFGHEFVYRVYKNKRIGYSVRCLRDN